MQCPLPQSCLGQIIISCFNIGHPKVVLLDVNFPVKIVVCNCIDSLFWGSIGLKIPVAPQVWGSTVSPVVWQKCSGKDQLNVSYLGWHNGREGVSVKLIGCIIADLKDLKGLVSQSKFGCQPKIGRF
jgi:hypothetical protein